MSAPVAKAVRYANSSASCAFATSGPVGHSSTRDGYKWHPERIGVRSASTAQAREEPRRARPHGVVVELELREACQADVPFLWRMLTLAASLEGTSADVERARVDPDLRSYVEGFGRRGDVGVVGIVDRIPAGAAWVRLAPPGPVSSMKVWTDEVPELAVATVHEMRGCGVGAALMRALLEAARPVHSSIALSVRECNAAVRLYERLGFSVQRRIVNRVGTGSLVMTRAL